MIPGQLTESETLRMIPGRFMGDEDDLPGRGLDRMVPGESSSPESQPTAPSQPRVVTGVDRESDGTNISTNISCKSLILNFKGCIFDLL